MRFGAPREGEAAITEDRAEFWGLKYMEQDNGYPHPIKIDVESAPSLVRPGLKTPRAAAIAGVVFSILLICSFWLLWRSVPVDPLEAGSWLDTHSRRVSFALNLIPFAGVAFFWFLGVLRDRLGQKEDQFFATIFLGSGIMFLGMIFVAAAAMGALTLAHSTASSELPGSATFAYGRALAYSVMQIYALKMGAVFIITTSTLTLKTALIARWIAFLGYVSAALLLIGSGRYGGVLFIFPAWVLLVSVYILVDNLLGNLRVRRLY